MTDEDDDFLEGCGEGFDRDPTPNEDIPWVVLFASVDESHRGLWGTLAHRHDVGQLADEWADIFGGSDA